MNSVDFSSHGARLHSLTSLRFFAAAFVVVHHTTAWSYTPIADLGFLGVTFFFVLSGFVLMWASSDRHGVGAFYRNRLARVYPLHVITLFIAVALPLKLNDNGLTFLQNLLLMQAWTPGGVNSFNWVSWSISAEAFFYLLFPLISRMLRDRPLHVLISVAAVAWIIPATICLVIKVVLPSMAEFLTYNFPPYRLGEFVIGICLAIFMKRRIVIPKVLTRMAISLAGFGLVLVLAADFLHPVPRGLYSAAFLPSVVAGIYTAVRGDLAGKTGLLAHPFLIRLGDWSFALYMVHTIVIRVISGVAGSNTAGLMPLWSIPPILAASVVLAALAYKYVELPFERKFRSKPTHVSSFR